MKRESISWVRRLAFLVGGIGALQACSKHKADMPAPEDTGEVVIEVDNHHWGDVDIYVYHDGQLNRVGQVTANSQQNITFSSTLLGHSRQIRLKADAVGSPEEVWTQILVIQPGAWIDWTLERSLTGSSVAVH